MTRLDRLAQRLGTNGLDGLLVASATNQRYLCGYTGHAAHLLVSPRGTYLITDYRYAEVARESCRGAKIVVRDRLATTLADEVQRWCHADGWRRVGFEATHTSYAEFQALSAARIELVPTTGLVEDLRYVKDPAEVEALRRAAAVADRALAQLLATDVRTGRTERELARALEAHLFDEGAEDLAFDTIMLSGPRSALPHGQPTDRAIAAGELLLIDFGAVVEGYRSDMTRTFVVGTADDRQRAAFEAVGAAQRAGLEALGVGVDAEEPSRAARAVLDATPFGAHAGEGLGHGLGLDLHERPFMGFRRPDVLEDGCVVTVEPGVYIPGWGGIRLEDDVLVTAKGAERLTRSPQTLELPA